MLHGWSVGGTSQGGGGGKLRGLGPRNDVLTTCKAVNPRASQRPSKAAVCFLTISTLTQYTFSSSKRV